MSKKDDVYYRTELSKYRILPNSFDVEIKLLERCDEPPERYCVKDGVVLESEILKEDDFLKLTEDFIKELRKDVEWHKLPTLSGSPLIYFAISLHPEIISKDEFRRFLRQTKEKADNGLLKINNYLKEKKSTDLLNEDHNMKYIWKKSDENTPEDKVKELGNRINTIKAELFNEKSKNYCGLREDEFRCSNDTLRTIDLFLNRKETPTQKEDPLIHSTIVEKSHKGKWIIVIILSIIALSWGVWTAIGVFILGSIIIGLLSK